MRSIILTTMVFFVVNTAHIIAQDQTVNGVLTVNTSGANTIRVLNDVAGEEATIRLRSKPSNGSGWLHTDISTFATGSNTGFLGFKVPHSNSFGGGYKMVIDHLGRTGIGTTIPGNKLEVNTTSNNDGILLKGNSVNNRFIMQAVQGTTAQKTFALNVNSANNDLIIQALNDDKTFTRNIASFQYNGNVGFGTTNPNARITIEGDGSTVGSSAINFKHSGNGMSIGLNRTTNNLVVGSSWNPESGTYLTIEDGTGKVGIGTSDFSGTHKLRVEGSIGTREVKVQATGWSDFVFDDNYQLPSIEEVEKHILEKGHLPEIPNEEEVIENGINLGEMDAKLLQKIEELTLYVIDLNKQVKTQNEIIEQLQKQLLEK